MQNLQKMGPSRLDAEIRSLGPEGGGSAELLQHFLLFITHALRTHRNYELLQAWLALCLKVRRSSTSSR